MPDQEYDRPVVVGSLIAGVFFGGLGGGVAFPTLPSLGTVLGISPFLVGLISRRTSSPVSSPTRRSTS
jgi:hypothetical protein